VFVLGCHIHTLLHKVSPDLRPMQQSQSFFLVLSCSVRTMLDEDSCKIHMTIKRNPMKHVVVLGCCVGGMHDEQPRKIHMTVFGRPMQRSRIM